MSIKELVMQKPEGIQLKDVAPELDAELTKITNSVDKKGRKCLYLEWSILNGSMKGKKITVKYSPYHFASLIEAMKKVKIEEFKIGQQFHLKTVAFAMGFPRHMPDKML